MSTDRSTDRGAAMSTDTSAANLVPPQAQAEEPPALLEPAEAAEATGPRHGDPMVLGLPSFIVGSVALGLALVGVVPAAAVGAALPIILAATAVGQLLATIWSASLGQNAVASVFGIFAGFWLSYAVLVLGLTHGWFGVAPASIQATQELFLVSWLVAIVMLTVCTLRLPVIYTALFVLVDLALFFVFLGVNMTSSGLLKTGGWFVLIFAAVGVYLYASTAAEVTGGHGLPLGKPTLH